MSEEVIEKPCRVKLVPRGELEDHIPEGSCCRNSPSGGPSTKQLPEEEKCLSNSTSYFERTTSQYKSGLSRGEESVAEEGFHGLRHQLLSQSQLFVDASFPPNDRSVSFTGITRKQYEWRRPREICKDPHFFIDGATRFDIQQGDLGDCWLLAAVANLTLHPNLFRIVVPDDQGMNYMYAGMFYFRFWQYGRWEEVVVDDLLPTHRGQLVFMHSKTENEFWCALLEKAYAKVYGCYEALRGGTVSESMVDLTGGVVETIDVPGSNPGLFGKMMSASHRGAMLGCAIEPDDPRLYPESVTAQGLIVRHAYSVTKATRVPSGEDTEELVRLHNPWGNEVEWKGPWSDKSPEWKLISSKDKLQLGITFNDDGEFWMPFSAFRENFTTLEICDVTPDVFLDAGDDVSANGRSNWKMKLFHGEWIKGRTAGGCRNYLETFPRNPQYFILLDDDYVDESNLCTLVVSVMQKHVRQRKKLGAQFAPIGFVIYKLPPGFPPGKPLTTDFFKYNASVAKAPYFLNNREVAHHFRFSPGVYVIIPSTFEPSCEAQFLLRIFTEGRRSPSLHSP